MRPSLPFQVKLKEQNLKLPITYYYNIFRSCIAIYLFVYDSNQKYTYWLSVWYKKKPKLKYIKSEPNVNRTTKK